MMTIASVPLSAKEGNTRNENYIRQPFSPIAQSAYFLEPMLVWYEEQVEERR
jgi:hypothetical protein